MPPWAVPVWERVGYSLEMTAVRTRSEASMAARSPAPPAPTITASYVWTVVTRSRRSRPPAGVEGEDDDRPQREQAEADHVEQHVHREPRARPLHVVLHDHPQAVDPMEQRQDEERPVPGPPNRTLPPHRDEPEVHPLHASVEDVHDQDVAHGEEQQDDAGDPHEQPGPQLEAAPRPLPPGPTTVGTPGGRHGGRALRGLHGHQRFHPKARFRMSRPMIHVMGTMASRNRPVDAMDSCFMYLVEAGQESNTRVFTPLMA